MAYPHVVIVGGGFGGLYAARALANQPVSVTLIDRQNYHLLQPLLYQVATPDFQPEILRRRFVTWSRVSRTSGCAWPR